MCAPGYSVDGIVEGCFCHLHLLGFGAFGRAMHGEDFPELEDISMSK